MPSVKVNLSGINELDFPSGVSSATTSDGVTTINLSGGGGGTPGGTNGQIQYNASGSFGGFTAGQDAVINTTTGNVTVEGIQTIPVDPTAPILGQVLEYNGTKYIPTTPGTGGITQLTGDVHAGPGSGSQAATIQPAAVTLAKIQNATANSKLLGSGASGSGSSYSEITLGSNLSMTGTTLNATSGSFQFTVLGNPPPVGSFTWVNQGGNTTRSNNGAICMNAPNTVVNWRLLTRSSPVSAPWSVAAAINNYPVNANSSAVGLYLYDGTKLLGMEMLAQSGAYVLRVERITNITTDNTTVYTTNLANATPPPPTIANGVYATAFLRWRNDGTTLYADASLDGAIWFNLYSEAVGTWITPNAYGWGAINVITPGTVPINFTLVGWLETNSAVL